MSDIKPNCEHGYMSSRVSWSSHHGYRYDVFDVDEGCFQIDYVEIDPDTREEKREKVMEFNSMDAGGLIECMKRVVAMNEEFGNQ